MIRTWIVDAGPIVALLSHKDRHREWITNLLGSIGKPLLVCEPVLTEAAFLLGRSNQTALVTVLGLLQRGALSNSFRLSDEIEAIAGLARKYSDVPMSLADACLVLMSEIHTDSALITFDSDFHIYRRNGRQPVTVLMPE